MLEALKTISLLADGEDPDTIEFGVGPAVPGDLAASFTELEVCILYALLDGSLLEMVFTCGMCMDCIWPLHTL